MARHTINLGKARIAGRNKRAKKAVAVLREELKRREKEEVKLSSEINQKIWENGARQPPAKIQVETEAANDGLKATLVEEKTTKTETQRTEKEDKSEVDYEKIVSGTIGEAKEAIEELDQPDYEKLLEAEESNKDRKTLKEHIESLKE